MAEPYNCERDCVLPDNTWDNETRSAKGCQLYGAPRVEAKPTALALYQISHSTPYMGRRPDLSLRGKEYLGLEILYARPIERPEDGCPAAWYRTPFISSLIPFLRRRTESGGRVDNPMFLELDWQAQEAIMYFEEEQERALAYRAELSYERIEKARKKAATPAPARRIGRGRRG